MDKIALKNKIRALEGLTNDEKAALLELLNKQKKYGLVWEDKPEDVEERLRDELPVLKEVKERFIPSDDPEALNHILIEGDNLEALTALTYTHAGKIDVIYIDPPYNTGNKDFVYNDSFVDSEDSFRHSKWLSFMSKRLKLAKGLLSDKGVIFISIDDNEQAQLKLLCDEIFSNLDFVATIPWRKRTAKSDVPHSLSQDYEWILCYANKSYKAGIKKETRKYFETDDFPNRPWRVHDMSTQRTADERPNSNFTIIDPKNGKQYPVNKKAVWRITKEGFPEYLEQNRIVFPGDYEFLRISKPVLRYWKEDDEKKAGDSFGFTAVSDDISKEVGMTQDGTKDLDKIFDGKPFGFPKPLSLISFLLRISNPQINNVQILDFFAGSGTTLHATMQLNAEDGGHRKCILVTNNENNICEEVTYERNKRVINGYTTPKGEAVEGLKSNTLRYYKTDFVCRDQSAKNMRALVAASTDLLCIKNDIYTEAPFAGKHLNSKIARYFENRHTRMLVIYNKDYIFDIVHLLTDVAMDERGKIKVYTFADGRYAYDDDFMEVADKVELCALPAAIYDAYKHVLPKRKPQYLPEALIDKEAAEASAAATSTQGSFNFD